MKLVSEVAPLSDYRLQLRFNDGTAGVVKLDPWQRGPVLVPLRDPEEFGTVQLDGDGGICWRCGTDFDPQVLYEMLVRKHEGSLATN